MAQPRMTFGYWNIRGLAAGARQLLFHCGFTDFEDVKYVSGDRASWLSVKPTLGLDFPNLPYLIDHVTGVRLTQSMAIFHYIASCASDPTLVTGAPELAAYVTMLANQAMDLRNSMVSLYYGGKSDADVQTFLASLGGMLEPFEKWLVKNSAVGPFLAGKLCYVDFFFAEHLDQLMQTFPGCIDSYPALKAYHQQYFALPTLQAFMASPYYFKSPINGTSAFIKG